MVFNLDSPQVEFKQTMFQVYPLKFELVSREILLVERNTQGPFHLPEWS